MGLFGDPYNDLVIYKDSPDYLGYNYISLIRSRFKFADINHTHIKDCRISKHIRQRILLINEPEPEPEHSKKLSSCK